MSEFPIQTRTIDPYSSYNSNVVNQLTRMITRGKNCLHGIHAIDVVIDSTSTDTEIVVLPGEGFKDDVIIQINERKTIDMSDMNYYINHLNPFNEAGYYYVCIEYTYAKARPAPEAKIRLLKPSQHSLYDPDNSAFLLLKVVNVIFNGTTFEVDELFDIDPSNPAVVRVYSQLYAGAEDSLPIFDQNRDEGRLVYAKDRDEMFFGIENRWESFNAVRANIDTSNCEPGDLGYIDEFGQVQLALAQSLETLTDCIVLTKDFDKKGKVRLFGETTAVNIESSVCIAYGDSLYLSKEEPGKITNMKPFEFPQFIGISVSDVSVNNTCDIWFLPDRTSCNTVSESTFIDFYQDLLNNSIFTYLFVENFGNDDFIDSTSSCNIINTYDYSLAGGTGTEVQTTSLQLSSFASRIHLAQISARCECSPVTGCVSGGYVDWYISNNGSDDYDWEKTELDKLHNFSTYGIEFSSTTGSFELGEMVTSSITGKVAYVNAYNNGRLLLAGDTQQSTIYNIGEVLTGGTSGATGIVSIVLDRQDPAYHDLRIKIIFNGPPDSVKIFDYGIIYDQDEDIFNEVDVDIEKNLDTVYLDMYTHPHQDNDGNPNLTIPLETQIYNLDTTSTTRMDQIEIDITNVENNINTVENNITYIYNEVTDIQNVLDTTAPIGLIQVNDNDITTLYADVYTSPSRDDDGIANLTTPLETQISNLETQVAGLAVAGMGSVIFITTADTTPDVSSIPSMIRIDYSSPLTITDFDNGVIGQELVIVFTNTNTTVEYSANITLENGNDFVSDEDYVLTLIHNGTRWVEKSSNKLNVVYSGSTPSNDPTNFYTIIEVDSMFDNLSYSTGTTGATASGGSTYYTKTQIDSMFDNVLYSGGTTGPVGGAGASEWYTKAQIDAKFSNIEYI